MGDSERLDSALRTWAARLGNDGVIQGPRAQQTYGASTSGVERSIPAALRPKTVDDVVAIVDVARQHDIPLYPVSTGHNWGYGTANPVADDCVIVDLSGLDRIVEMDAELGLVTVEPGVTQKDLRDYLDRNGLRFMVPVTGAGPRCSLIGNALERGYGITPYADHFAALTTLEAVLPDGRVYRSALSELGGQEVDRAFKWGIAAYLDGLFSQGNFGIVTRATIALAPDPERIEAFFFGVGQDAGLEAAVTAIRTVLRTVGGVTGSINLMNARRVLAMMVPYPQARVGSTGILPPEVVEELSVRNRVTAWTGFGALYGKAEVVKAARAVVRRVLKPVASRLWFVTPGFAGNLSRWLGHVPALRRGRFAALARTLDSSLQLVAGGPNQVALPLAYWRSPTTPVPGRDMDPARDGCGLIWYPPLVPMKPARVRQYVEMVDHICESHGIEPLITLTSLSDRCFDSSVPLLFNRADAGELSRARSCYKALFEAGEREGFLPYRMGVDSMDWIMRPGTPFWDIVAKIKAGIDPRGIISPGRYAP